jgi:hypothetical protein
VPDPVPVAFRYYRPRAAQIGTLRTRRDPRPRLLVVSTVVRAAVTAAFALHIALHLGPSAVATVGGLAGLPDGHDGNPVPGTQRPVGRGCRPSASADAHLGDREPCRTR